MLFSKLDFQIVTEIMTENQISKILIEIFIKVHSQLGPGLLESVYETAICYELTKRSIPFKRQAPIPVYYDDIKMDMGFRADIIVADKVVVEIKSIETVAPIHPKILITYLKLSKIKLGLLVNFNVTLIKNGITRLVNNLEDELIG